MSTNDPKLQQATLQSEERSSVARVVSNQDRFHTHTDKARSQDVSEDEPSTRHFHIKKDFESKTTASSKSVQLSGQQNSSRDLQIKQIILLRSNKDSSKTSDDQKESSRFTAVLSIRLPTKINKKDTTEDTEETLLKDTDIDDSHETTRRTAYKYNTELRDRFSTTEKLFKDGDGPKAHFDKDSFTNLQSQHGLTTPPQGQETGIQHNIDLHEQTQIANSQRHSTLQSICVIQTELSKGTNANKESGATDHTENVLTTQNNSQLTSLGKENSLKASAHCEVLASLRQVLSLTPASGSNPDPEQSHLNPASAMLASALVSVLSPPWSGRLRRPKQGGNEVEHESQDSGHNANPSNSLRQDPRQQPLLSIHRTLAERVSQESNNNTARTSYSSSEWQKENSSPNITTIQSKRAILKASSVDIYRATMHNNAELHRVPTPLDTGQVPKSPCSEERRGYIMSKTEDQNETFKSLSSKPTTSSLLLSLRRANLRRLNEESTQMQTPITRSVRSLTLPSRGILKKAQSYTSVISHEEASDTTVPYAFPDTPSKTEGVLDTSNYPFLPRSKRVVTMPSLFLNKTDSEISKNQDTFIIRGEEQQSPSFTTKSSRPEIPKSQQNSQSTKTEFGDAVELVNAKNTIQQNVNINNNQTFTKISSIDQTNLNRDVPQTGFNDIYLKSQSKQNIPESKSIATRTFTDSLKFSPRKESFSVDGINTTNKQQTYQDNERKISQSSQNPMDLSSPLSPSRPTKGFRVPSIYSYLRESSPAVSTTNSPSTPFSHTQRAKSSSSPMQGGGEIQQGDRNTVPSRFSFDIGPFNSQSSDSLTGPAQSLPPDFGRKSAPRLSTSPYSTLISSRPALNSTLHGLSSPPVVKPQEKSTENDTITIRVYPIKLAHPNPSSSMYKSVTKRPKEQQGSLEREQQTSTTNTVQAYSGAPENQKPVRPCLSQTVPHASFVTECQSANITLHPRQQNTCSQEEHKASMAVQLNKDNSYTKHRLSQKESKVRAESKSLLEAEKESKNLQMHERLQEIPNSKKGLFTLWSKKDNVFTSDSVADKDNVTPQYLKTKRNVPVLKTSSRIDQMLSRLKQTFGGKRSDNIVDTKTGNTDTQKSLYTETFETNKRDDKKCSESQWEPSLINDKASLKSLSSARLIKSKNMPNANVPNMAKDEKMTFECQWDAPNSSLTTEKSSLPSLESLSPLTLRKCERTLNVDEQRKVKGEITHTGSQWEATNSSSTNDNVSLPSLESLSSKTFIKTEKTVHVDRQSKVESEKQCFGSHWEAPNSSLTTDKASFSSLKSLSPITCSKPENRLNMDLQKRWSDEQEKWSCSSSKRKQNLHSMNRSATLPHYRNSSFDPSSPFHLSDYDSEDIQNDNVFYSPVSKKSNSLCESDNVPQLSYAKSIVPQNLTRSRLSSSCADLKYGLNNGRSFSVSSVVSSRPSGPGRISTSSVSDLSSLDDLMTKGNNSGFGSPINISYSPTYGAKTVTSNQSQTGYTNDQNLDQNEDSSCFWDDADPTPPPSPPFSPSSRRMSQAPAVSSPIRTTPESPARGMLPSRSYSTSLTVFEESDSDSTTDDEYFLHDDIETEL